MPNYLEIAERAARVGGKILLDWRGKFQTRQKGRNDFVTDADFASQQAIREVVLGAFPEHEFLGEEDIGGESVRGGEFRWLVDPLDGTANYVHQLQTFAVSIALEQRGRLIVGVIYDPVSDECFTAEAGGGAKLNGAPLRVSECRQLSDAMVAISFSNAVARDSVEITRFVETLLACQSIRRLGSAALNLAYIAAGRLDAYFATSVKIWDVAAGVLIVREAGGTVTALLGGELNLERPEFLASASGRLQQELVELLKRAEASR